jgi:hypothetical protein
METSASFEARYAPLPYPTNHLPYEGAICPGTAFILRVASSGVLLSTRLLLIAINQ